MLLASGMVSSSSLQKPEVVLSESLYDSRPHPEVDHELTDSEGKGNCFYSLPFCSPWEIGLYRSFNEV